MAGESTRVLDRGDPAPEFSLPGTDGETYSPDDFRECDALLVVFTCNHCPYAQAKHPTLNAIAADYDDVAVVGINSNDADAYPDDSFAAMRDAVREGTVAYDAYLRDESQTTAAAYGAVCTPDPFLFANRDGLELAYHGRLDDAQSPDSEPSGEPGFEMRDAIDTVLAGEDVTREFAPARGCTIKWKPGNEPDYWGDL
ncbi:thioredoxin family protein [Salarchaeum sp. JOR-1]|uniref:thioredoxin family protein n=1 Tax=Salarchaeum sp. JOR-1 TaxID=2599399 RepID=UPI0011989310|nr:thioredoxin family protein [Salarchaeum sp. JOR-1]QDX39837.1 thioredoxin family protein [Salarchaeum sp. JOR-1]